MMLGCGLPYVSLPTWAIELPGIGPLHLTVFGVLAATGLVIGSRLATHYASVRGLDRAHVDALVLPIAMLGLLSAHVVSVGLYFPEQVAAHPWLLLDFTSGYSSVGGFIGGALAFWWLTGRRGLDRRAHADAIAFGLLAGFTIGRLGCALVHDHRGLAVSAETPLAWLAVGPWPDGTHRFDLGLVEWLGLLGICAFFYRRFDWRSAAPGRFTGWLAIVYAVARFPLDWLRVVDRRYLGLTSAQLACIGMFVAGCWLLRERSRSSSRPGYSS